MVNREKNIDRYRKVMRFAYGLWTVIWLGLVTAIYLFASDHAARIGLIGLFALLYVWVLILYRRNVRQAVAEYRQKTAKINKNGCESDKPVV